MDATAAPRDLEMDENTGSNEIPTQCENFDSDLRREKSPPSSLQPQADEELSEATEPFQPIFKLLAELEQDDPKLAFQAARILGLYRRLWESCMSKHGGNENLEQANHGLKEENVHLENEKSRLQGYHDEQRAQFDRLNQAVESSQVRLVNILDDWGQYSRSQVAELMDCDREW
ncbi:uncharacterized protein N7469_002059 [Penicillium citrinum]|uniref:Uncharacterized protein n=1 Tax=Penicillium citrinum TaxID=5077 RepID=A0A9W9P9R6_PENCI|nr:uncharacterized protein N7469_002059 [Penicillium citrinum]KAJ5240468.1 hypothetical protein N7469_002059 [Penicillium citrinum]